MSIKGMHFQQKWSEFRTSVSPAWYPRRRSLHKIHYFSLNTYISISYNKYIRHSFRNCLKIIFALIANLRGLAALTQPKCRKIRFPRTISNCSQPIKPKERPINRPPFQYWINLDRKLVIILSFFIIPSCQLSPAFCESKTLIASFYSLESLKKEGTFKYSKGVMANGKLFKDENFTAASWDFPLNSLVEITNLKNPDKKIKVKVTDRTARRFKGKRIDLTPAAMEALGDKQALIQGLIEVNVERIR